MARHSKNNTAGSVFTYGERQKLKQSNEWGEINARIGTDSQKKFEQCNLCLKMLEEPVACPRGHLFCNPCIIENLMIQKKDIKKKIKAWEEKNKEEERVAELNSNKNKKMLTDNFKRVEDGIEEVEFDGSAENQLAIPEDKIERFKMIEEIKKQKSNIPMREKSELTKNCFWIPEKTPEADKKKSDKPSEKLCCPVKEKNHFIKLKELMKVKLHKSEAEDKFSCNVCNKDISFQKVVLLKKCGHVMCKKCLDTIAKKDEQCPSCFEAFYPSEIINLQESGTAFSIHNQVETQKLNPFFKY